MRSQKIVKLSTPVVSHNFAPSTDLECVYQSTDRCGRVANPYRSSQEHGLLSDPVLSPKPCYRNPFPMTDRKFRVLDDGEEGVTCENGGRKADVPLSGYKSVG